MKNSFFNKFVPKQPKFFELLRKQSELLNISAGMLAEYVADIKPEERAAFYNRIKEVERNCDTVTHRILDELETTFITPIDREDINALATAMDDVIDSITSCAKRINIYNPQLLSGSAQKLSQIICQDAACISNAIGELDHFRGDPSKMRTLCTELHDLENLADDIYENFIKQLFEEEKNVIEIIKIKEVMHEMERTTDAAEHVGKILKSLVVKYV